MDFVKAHGTGNDFVVLADLDDQLDLHTALVTALCDRRFGVGADGVIRLGAPADGADVFMDYRNGDGAIVEMCGNGVRVVAKHVVDHNLVAAAGDVVRVGTRSGVKAASIRRGRDGTVAEVSVDMGAPLFDPADVPFDAARPGALNEPLDVDGKSLEVSVLSMGNPHAVTRVEDVAAAPVATLGPRVEGHDRFAKGVNVEFAEVVSSSVVRLRVWERGVGETAACGTGVCAAVVALQRLGRVGSEVEVNVPGGVLNVRYDPVANPSVLLSGPAVEVAHGTLDAAWLAGVTR